MRWLFLVRTSTEARGIGGLFFDYSKVADEMSLQDWLNFVSEVGNSFIEAYVPIVEGRKELTYTSANRTCRKSEEGVMLNLI